MSITSDLIRGHTDAIILGRLKNGDSYGYEINKAVRRYSGGKYELKEATLYTAFRRMEEQGYISSYWGEGDVGGRRRYYSITEEGRRTYVRLKSEWLEAKEIIDSLMDEEEDEVNVNA